MAKDQRDQQRIAELVANQRALRMMIKGQREEIADMRAQVERAEAKIAAAWDEGNAAGWSRGLRYMTDEPYVKLGSNPYRAAPDISGSVRSMPDPYAKGETVA